jgi:VWFA-related protein
MQTFQRLSPTLSFLLLLGTLEGQATPAPSLPQPSPSAVAPARDDASPYRITVQVRRVIVDVVVTDSKGNPVEGLKKDDFKVMEDGVTQSLRSFDAHTLISTGASQPPLSLHLPPNTFTNLALAPADRPVTVLLYDMLNTPQAALPYAHEALVQFIKDQKSSSKIAIFALTDRLHMVQGFTADETRLIAAVDSKKANTRISQLRTAEADTNEAALLSPDLAASPTPANPTPPSTGADEVLAQLQDAVQAETDYQQGVRLQVTVEAFSDIARFVSLLPGRKNLIWMAGAFPVEMWPGRKQYENGGAGAYNIATQYQAEIRAAQELLKDSRIAIYPVDVRGLQADPQFTGSALAARMPSRVPVTGGGSLPPPTFGVQQGAEHAIMDSIAESTGGRAFYNTNGLREAMDAALRQGSEYYSLTYAPNNEKQDGGERHVKVVLSNPSYHLSYRTRYLARDANQLSPARPLALDQNMQHGAPDSSELFFEVKIVPVGSPMPASTAEVDGLTAFLGTTARGKRTKTINGPTTVQHYEINLAVVGRQLDMPPVEVGKYFTNMRFGLAAYGENSELLNGMEVKVKNQISAEQYHAIQSQGYQASMLFVVPHGAVSLRIAVRDELGDRIGTMEVPLPVPELQRSSGANTP